MISPYGAQVRLLREQLDVPGLEIDSVDGFQGREKEAVVISLVRSNPKGEIGFLGDIRRMNVAMTRARRKLLMVGDSATLGGHPFYSRLLEYCEGLGAYRTVWEEVVITRRSRRSRVRGPSANLPPRIEGVGFFLRVVRVVSHFRSFPIGIITGIVGFVVHGPSPK